MRQKRTVAWPDKKTYLEQVRTGVFADSELTAGLLAMGPMPDVEGEVPAEVARAIRREANRLRAEAGLPPLPETDEQEALPPAHRSVDGPPDGQPPPPDESAAPAPVRPRAAGRVTH